VFRPVKKSKKSPGNAYNHVVKGRCLGTISSPRKMDREGKGDRGLYVRQLPLEMPLPRNTEKRPRESPRIEERLRLGWGFGSGHVGLLSENGKGVVNDLRREVIEGKGN